MPLLCYRVLPSCKKHHHRGPQEQGTENRIACRRSAKSLAASHISTLHQLLSAAAVKSDPSVALQHMNRQPVRQLVQLTAHLVRAADPAQQQAMCDSMLKVD